MQAKRPFLLRTPGLLIIATIFLLYIFASKPLTTTPTKACCGLGGALELNGRLICANPLESMCDVDLIPEVEKTYEVMNLWNYQPTEADRIIAASVLGSAMGLGTAAWLIKTGLTERVADLVVDFVRKFSQTILA